jgi:hypothetical protein
LKTGRKEEMREEGKERRKGERDKKRKEGKHVEGPDLRDLHKNKI